jgi:prepilin-type processing-associated H-X9-DG protein
MNRVLLILIALPVALLILFVLSMTPVSGLMPHLLLGWMDFIQRNVHQMRFRWEVIWSVLLYMGILLVGGHFFAKWIYRSWKWSWSLRGLVVFLLMFIAGTSAVAVVEQSKWLVNSDQPLFGRNSCSRNLRQIGQALLLYQHDHQGKLPDDLAELLLSDLDPELLCCELAGDRPASGKTRAEVAANARQKGHCSYVYFGKGRWWPIADNDVLVCDDPESHGGGMYALFGDGHVEWIAEGPAQTLFGQARTSTATTRPATHAIQ